MFKGIGRSIVSAPVIRALVLNLLDQIVEHGRHSVGAIADWADLVPAGYDEGREIMALVIAPQLASLLDQGHFVGRALSQ